MKNKNRGFDNSLYAEAADAYHAFVQHYNLEPFLTRLHQQFNSMSDGRKCTLLELGAGTGVFTAPLSKVVNEIDAVEYSENQIHILGQELTAQKIKGVNVIQGDANDPESLGLRQAYDHVLFTFSLDNISNASVYEALDVAKMEALLAKYKPYLKPDGKMVVIGSMPEESIVADRKKKYEAYREGQFASFNKLASCEIDVFDYSVEFDSYADAFKALSNITSEETAQKKLLPNSNTTNLRAYMASFSPR